MPAQTQTVGYRPFKPIPFLEEFASNEKLDLKGIYLRPQRDEWYRIQKNPDGSVIRNVTGPLPLRRHYQDHQRKGFEFLTLADAQSLQQAAGILRTHGLDAAEYVCDPRTGSPWLYEAYAASALDSTAQDVEELRGLIRRYGRAAVLEIKRMSDPTYKLPMDLEDEDAVEVQAPAPPPLAQHDAPPPVKRKRGRPRKTEVSV